MAVGYSVLLIILFFFYRIDRFSLELQFSMACFFDSICVLLLSSDQFSGSPTLCSEESQNGI